MYEKDLGVFNVITKDIYTKAVKFKETGEILQLFAILGATHGIINYRTYDDKEKDFTQYNIETLSILKRIFLNNKIPFYQLNRGDIEHSVKNPPVAYEDIAKKYKYLSIVDSFNETLEKVKDLLNQGNYYQVKNEINSLIEQFLVIYEEIIPTLGYHFNELDNIARELSDNLVNIVNKANNNDIDDVIDILYSEFTKRHYIFVDKIKVALS